MHEKSSEIIRISKKSIQSDNLYNHDPTHERKITKIIEKVEQEHDTSLLSELTKDSNLPTEHLNPTPGLDSRKPTVQLNPKVITFEAEQEFYELQTSNNVKSAKRTQADLETKVETTTNYYGTGTVYSKPPTRIIKIKQKLDKRQATSTPANQLQTLQDLMSDNKNFTRSKTDLTMKSIGLGPKTVSKLSQNLEKAAKSGGGAAASVNAADKNDRAQAASKNSRPLSSVIDIKSYTTHYKKFNFKSDFAKELLLRAIIVNDKHYVTAYVKHGGQINFEVLHFTLEDQQLQILLQPPTRPRPLHLAVLLGRKRITALFLSKSHTICKQPSELLDQDYFTATDNALVNTKDAKLQTPLMLGCMAGHTNIVKFLLEKYGANLDYIDTSGLTVLQKMVIVGNFEIFLLLINHKINLEYTKFENNFKKSKIFLEAQLLSNSPFEIPPEEVEKFKQEKLNEILVSQNIFNLAVNERKSNFLAKVLIQLGDAQQIEYILNARKFEKFLQDLLQNIVAIENNEELSISSDILEGFKLIGKYFRPHVAAKLMKQYGFYRIFNFSKFMESLKVTANLKIPTAPNQRKCLFFNLNIWRNLLDSILENKIDGVSYLTRKDMSKITVPLPDEKIRIAKFIIQIMYQFDQSQLGLKIAMHLA